jgi:hypothetical protein
MRSKQVAAGAAALSLMLVAPVMPGDAVGAALTRASEPSLRLYVTPRLTRAPATVRIHAFVAPDADNRELEFVVESSAYFRSSAIQLSGADAPRVHAVEFRSIPVGTHDVRVVLTGRARAVQAVEHDRVAVFE